ncbi:hypothetical protein [Streptomyces sp. MS2.AVA.5]|uniref:Uncharacterized protein n=1 Tax=Streptomyces achmelvichensis TaxID=3134111 RepID=A0ACC6PW85_9ACTN
MAFHELLGPSIGALATLAGVVAGGGIGSRSQERHWMRNARREACADVLRAYVILHGQLGRWARRGERPDIEWSEWGHAMNMVRLVATPEVIAAGDAINAELWQIERKLKSGQGGLENWLVYQEQLEARHLQFINAARGNLDRRSAGLSRSVGRPPADHPMWRSS